MRRLIVNADDFGLCSGTVRGILHGVSHGIITSTSIMLTVPAAGLALQEAHDRPDLDVGVHLTFTEGRPLLPPEWVSSLINEQGRFPTSSEWLASGRRPAIDELQAEFRAQIESTIVAAIKISHLDLHTAAGYLLPGVFELTVKLAAHYGVAILAPLGEGSKQIAIGLAHATGLSLDEAQAMIVQYGQMVAASEVAHPDRLLEAFPGGNTDPAALSQLIRDLPEGTTELLTHPAFAAGCRRYLGEHASQRAAELAALCDPIVRQAVTDAGIQLVSFRQL
jgi:predicted glycoside hydrolase/deacetylase ChbG (UPF0249 family)